MSGEHGININRLLSSDSIHIRLSENVSHHRGSSPVVELPTKKATLQLDEIRLNSSVEDEDAEGAPFIEPDAGWCVYIRHWIHWSGIFPQFVLHGDFARRIEYAFRVGVTLVLSLPLASIHSIADHISAPFLLPVLAVIACGNTLGHSINLAWQIIKGTFYAALFGYIVQACGVGYKNDSRVATAILLFIFSVGVKYFIPQRELTTKKLAAGLNATILITQLNFSQSSDYSWRILATACMGSACAVIANMFPFPRPALKEVEERWQHSLRQSAHLFKLIIKGFSCISQTEFTARLIASRLDQTARYLVANEEMIKKRMKDIEFEFPVIFYHLIFGTYNNYMLERYQLHCQTFQQLLQNLTSMAFSLQTLPFDEFHSVCIQYVSIELAALSQQFDGWIEAVIKGDKLVKREDIIYSTFLSYTETISAVFDKYLQFRADVFFKGKLWLVDLHNGRKAVLRTSMRNHSSHEHDNPLSPEVQPFIETHEHLDKLHPLDGPSTPLRHRSNGSDSNEAVTFHDDDANHVLFHNEHSSHTPVFAPATGQADCTPSKSESRPPHPTTNGHALPASSEPVCSSDPFSSPSSNRPARVFTRNGGDFSWTSEDILSLNFFMFQLNEFTRRSLKLRREPQSSDPKSSRHFGHIRDLPRFVSYAFTDFGRSLIADIRESLRWDSRRFIEALKLAIAITLAAANELIPTDWKPIYERTHHGWWAAVTVAFTMADSFGGHVSTMTMRALGTCVGAVVGYLIARVSQDEVAPLVITLAIWGMATTYSRNHPSYGYAHLVAGFTAVVVAVGSDPLYGSVSEFAFVRIQETLIGVIIGLVIHNVILPQHARTLLHDELLKNIRLILQTFEHSFGRYQNHPGFHPLSPPPSRSQTQPVPPPNTTIAPLATPDAATTKVTFDVPKQNGPAPPLPPPPPSSSLAPRNSAVDMVSIETQTDPPEKLPLNPSHAFSKIGPKVFASLDTQASLCATAQLEPTMWRIHFPLDSYHRIISIQRTIGIYLYCMDLALQRITHSDSQYLMPDVDHHFTRLKVKVSSSLKHIYSKLLESYTRDSTVSNTTTPLYREGNPTNDGVSVVPPANSNLNSPLAVNPSSLGPSNSPLAQRIRAHSVVAKDDLIDLTSSLVELESRYKTWIDARVLAKRQQIDEAEAAEARHQLNRQRSVTPTSIYPEATRNIRVQSNGDAVRTASAADPFAMLSLLPLDTPNTTLRHLSNPGPSLVQPKLAGPQSIFAEDVTTDTQQNGATSSTTNVDRSSVPPHTLLSVHPSHVSPSPHMPTWADPSLARLEFAGLNSLSVTFTRSMDVLALNTFLFATRGSV